MISCLPARLRDDKRERANPLRTLAAAGLLLAAHMPAQAESVICHITYGGATRVIEAMPTTSPYQEKGQTIGSFFQFRIVFRRTPADLAGIKLYTYSNPDSGPVLIHQGSYAYPPRNAPQGGFTGWQVVHEPMRDGELQYWCELKAGR